MSDKPDKVERYPDEGLIHPPPKNLRKVRVRIRVKQPNVLNAADLRPRHRVTADGTHW